MNAIDEITIDTITDNSLGIKLHIAKKTIKDENHLGLQVIDKEKKVFGIITDGDNCVTLVNKNINSIVRTKTTVNQVMNKSIYYAWSKIGIEIAFKQMRFKKTSRLLRLEINCKMKGLISLHNLINKPIVSGVSNFGNHSLWDESLTKTLKAFSEDNNNKNLNKDNEQSKKHIFKDNW